MRANYEIVDLDYVEKQAKVLMDHIQELKLHKSNETIDFDHIQKHDNEEEATKQGESISIRTIKKGARRMSHRPFFGHLSSYLPQSQFISR